MLKPRLKSFDFPGETFKKIICGQDRCGAELGVLESHIEHDRTAKAQNVTLLPGFTKKTTNARIVYELSNRAARWYRQTLRLSGQGNLENGKSANRPASFARRPIPSAVAADQRIHAVFWKQKIALLKLGLQMPDLSLDHSLAEQTERLEVPSKTFVRCPKCRALNYFDFWRDPDAEYTGGPIVGVRKPPRQMAVWLLPDGGVLSPDQQRWYDALASIGVEVHAWHPSDWQGIIDTMSSESDPNLGLPEDFVLEAEKFGLKPTAIPSRALPESARKYFEDLAELPDLEHVDSQNPTL